MHKLPTILFFLLQSLMGLVFSAELPLVVTFPDTVDTFAVDKLRLSGHTRPGAWVFVNKQPVRVFLHGAFVTRVDLQDGDNFIRVRANRDTLQAVQELYIYRPPKLTASDTFKTSIDTFYQEPASDLMVMPDDYIRVRIKGSPGGTARLSIDQLVEDVPMTELPPEEAMGLPGIYQGLVRAGRGPRNRPLNIVCTLKGLDGHTEKIRLSARVTIMTDDVPAVGQVTSETWLHTRVSGYMPMCLLQQGIRVYIVGKQGNRYKIALGPSQTGWVDAVKVDLLPWGTDIPVTSVSAPVLGQNNDFITLRFPVSVSVPYRLHCDSQSGRLSLTMYGAEQASHWVTWPNQDIPLQHVEFTSPTAQVLQIDITYGLDRLWGYSAEYTSRGLVVKLRKPPVMPAAPDSLFLDGWRIALDPGHGGDNEGSKSPSGYLEKEINLTWARILRDSLLNYGADVILTRNADSTISLRERMDTARQFRAHLLLSLHNNSTTAGGNALSVQGTSVYYLQPASKALAWAVYPHLLELGLEPYGRIHNAYYLTSKTDMPVLLIEGAFLSHPVEELKFKDSEFLQLLSGAIVKGLRQFQQSLSSDTR